MILMCAQISYYVASTVERARQLYTCWSSHQDLMIACCDFVLSLQHCWFVCAFFAPDSELSSERFVRIQVAETGNRRKPIKSDSKAVFSIQFLEAIKDQQI